MDIEKHYRSYKSSFSETMLPDYDYYVKFKNLRNYLDCLLDDIEQAFKSNNSEHYLTKIKEHQAFMLKIFEEMLDQAFELFPMTTGSDWVLLAKKHGWSWFKYSRSLGLNIKLDNDPDTVYRFIPRYSKDLEAYWKDLPSVFDADEVAYIESLDDPETIKSLRDLKKKNVNSKLSEGMVLPVEIYNRSSIRDWALPLGEIG